MKVLVALGLILAVLVVGSGLAALTVAENEPCSTWFGANEADAWRPQAVTNLVPLGTRCEYPPDTDTLREDFIPSASSYAAWLVIVAAAFSLAVWRWLIAAVRGAACALVISGLFGLLYVYAGEFDAAVVGSCVLGAPLVYALDVRARANSLASLLFCLALPVIANAAWFVPGLLGAYVAAAMCVAFAGALTSFAADRVGPSLTARTNAV
jgi:hypothetical protein